jgi:diacylglycerol kinase family enzyme
MSTYVLYNSLSGNGTGKTKAEEIKPFLSGKELVFEDVTKITDANAFFAGLNPDDELYLCGGDGTLNRFINNTDGIDIVQPLYFFPTGTGNDFWNDLGKKAGDAPAKINQYLVKLPKVTVNGVTRKFINGIGYGIDGYCCEEGDKQRAEFGGKEINYTAIAIKGLLFHYKPTHAKVTVDGVTTEYDRCWLAPTMNGRFYGGGMMATPDQDRLNPERTVTTMVMYGAGKLATLAAFPTIFKGEHVQKTKIVAVMTGKKVHVAFDRAVALQIDGETVLNVK